MKLTQRVPFRNILTPCCGYMLCWVNPRLPMYCPECGTMILTKVKECVMFLDDEATLTYKETRDD